MDTEVGDNCATVTMPDPVGDPTDGSGLSCAAVATNCRLQRLGTETETATSAAVDPKFEPSTVMVCNDATRCAADTEEIVGLARDRAGAGTNVNSGKLKIFMTPRTDNSSNIPTTSWACTLNDVCAHENEFEVNVVGMTRQGDTTDMITFETSAEAPKLEMGLRSIDCKVTLAGVGFEDTVYSEPSSKFETEPSPLNLTVSPTSNSEPDPDKTITLLVALRTCKRENTIVAATAEDALRNILPDTST
jgi:hypothetical protein